MDDLLVTFSSDGITAQKPTYDVTAEASEQEQSDQGVDTDEHGNTAPDAGSRGQKPDDEDAPEKDGIRRTMKKRKGRGGKRARQSRKKKQGHTDDTAQEYSFTQ